MNLQRAIDIAAEIVVKPVEQRSDIERALVILADYSYSERIMRGTRSADTGRVPVSHPAHSNYRG